MTSIFATDLSRPAMVRPSRCGALHGPVAIALTAELAEHFAIQFADVQAIVGEFFGRRLDLLQSPEGWFRFGEAVRTARPDVQSYRPTVH